MLKSILIILLGIFFLLNAVNHFYNEKFLAEYARKRNLYSPRLSVKAAGILLLVGGILLFWHETRQIAAVLLSVFLVAAAFLIHRFWEEETRDDRMYEAMHFAKNMAILTEMLYIGFV